MTRTDRGHACPSISGPTSGFFIIQNFQTNEQQTNKQSSKWVPWTADQRFDRNAKYLTSSNPSSDPIPAENGDTPFEIRSLMIDVARNFHSGTDL